MMTARQIHDLMRAERQRADDVYRISGFLGLFDAAHVRLSNVHHDEYGTLHVTLAETGGGNGK